MGTDDFTEPCDIQCAIGILPERELQIEVQVFPGVPLANASKLKDALGELRLPLVRHAPVGFVIRRMCRDGSPTEPQFEPPFCRRLPAEFTGTWDDAFALMTQQSQPPRKSNIKERVLSWFKPRANGASTSKVREDEGRYHPDEPLFPMDLGLSQAELDALAIQYPDDFAVFGMRGCFFETNGRFEEALDAYNRMVQLCPRDERVWYVRGICHYGAGNSARTLEDLGEAIRINPDYSTARLARAQLFIELGGFGKAKEDVAEAIRANPFNPTARFMQARLCLRDGEPDACLSELGELLEFAPYHYDAMALHVHVQRLCGLCESDSELIDQLSELIWLRDDDPWVYCERAEVRLQAGDAAAARADCETALSIDQDFSPAYGTRARVLAELQEYDAALKDCERAIELHSDVADFHLTKAQIHAHASELEEAMLSVNEALHLETHPISLALRAELHLAFGESDEAVRDFQEAVALAPKAGELHNRLGVAYSVNKCPEQAIVAFDRSIELDPKSPAFFANRAVCWKEQNEPDKALSDLNKALELSPDTPEIQMERAYLLANMNSPEAAVHQLDRIIEKLPDFAHALSMRAELSSRMKDFKRAEVDFQRLIEMYPDTAFAYTSRAAMWLRQGQIDKAEMDYQEAIRQSPEHAEQFHQHQLLTEATIKYEEERFEEAIRIASEAIEQYPGFAAAYHLRAAAYWYDEQLVEAADDYSYLLELSGEGNISVFSSRGQVYAEMGEYDLALKDLNQVIESEEKAGHATLEVYALNGRGLAYSGLRDWEAANRDFLRSIDLCPDNAWAHYNQGLMYFHQGRTKEAAVCFDLALALKNPKLTPRKRAKAAGFLRQCQESS